MADRSSAVLKVAMPHMEGEHEIRGLQFWNGDPTVRLIEADEGFGAMLLEHCKPGSNLRKLVEEDQDRVIATLLRRLWRLPPPGLFPPLSMMLEHWSGEMLARKGQWRDGGLVWEGLRLFKNLSQSARVQVLLATDLHAGNVLQAEREPWLVIDPKPFLGDPAYDTTQHLLNCSSRLHSDPTDTIRCFADLAEVDEERVRLWIFARLAAEPQRDWRTDHWIELAIAVAP
jgi:streptomycin 6-kinase